MLLMIENEHGHFRSLGLTRKSLSGGAFRAIDPAGQCRRAGNFGGKLVVNLVPTENFHHQNHQGSIRFRHQRSEAQREAVQAGRS